MDFYNILKDSCEIQKSKRIQLGLLKKKIYKFECIQFKFLKVDFNSIKFRGIQ